MKKITFLTIIAALTLAGCVGGDCCMPGVISVDRTTITFIGVGESKKVNIECPISWMVVDQNKLPDWFAIDPLNFTVGTEVTFTAQENNDSKPRNFTVTFRASNGDKVIVKLVQDVDPHLAFKSRETPRWEWVNGSTVREEKNADYPYIFITDDGFAKRSGDRLFSSTSCKAGRITSTDGSAFEIIEINGGFSIGEHPGSMLRTESGTTELDFLEIVKIQNGKLWIIFFEKNSSIERRMVQ